MVYYVNLGLNLLIISSDSVLSGLLIPKTSIAMLPAKHRILIKVKNYIFEKEFGLIK